MNKFLANVLSGITKLAAIVFYIGAIAWVIRFTWKQVSITKQQISNAVHDWHEDLGKKRPYTIER